MNGCCCPQCWRRGTIVRQTSGFRCSENLTFSGMKVLFWYALKEIESPTAWAHAGGDPICTYLLAYHLPPGVASVHPVPDHDPEGRRRDSANGALDTVRPDAQDSVTALLHLTKTMATARVLCHAAEHRSNTEPVNITLTEY